MNTGRCPKHDCEFTGFGTLVFCPKCETEDLITDDYVGYFADFMGLGDGLEEKAEIIYVYKDLGQLNDIVTEVVTNYKRLNVLGNITMAIYKVSRWDGEMIDYRSNDEDDSACAPVFAGFPGCSWIPTVNEDVENIPEAYVVRQPVKVISGDDV